MNTETIVKLVEEMVDLKIQQFAESTMKASPEVARILREKRATDWRRLEQIKVELVRLLNGHTPP
jgi:ubiquinone biosynthesis protein Coq4